MLSLYLLSLEKDATTELYDVHVVNLPENIHIRYSDLSIDHTKKDKLVAPGNPEVDALAVIQTSSLRDKQETACQDCIFL